MAQHEKRFSGSVWQGSCVLTWIAAGQLCILRGSNLNHPRYFAALLVNRIVVASAASALSHLKPLPHFTDFPWELSKQPRLPLVRNKKPLATFGATFSGTAKTQKMFAKKKSFGQSGKIWSVCIFGGCWLPNSVAILRHSATFCGNSVEVGATHGRFLSRFFFCINKLKKKNRFWQKTLREYFGFSAAILWKILKFQRSKSISQWSGLHSSAFSVRI